MMFFPRAAAGASFRVTPISSSVRQISRRTSSPHPPGAASIKPALSATAADTAVYRPLEKGRIHFLSQIQEILYHEVLQCQRLLFSGCRGSRCRNRCRPNGEHRRRKAHDAPYVRPPRQKRHGGEVSGTAKRARPPLFRSAMRSINAALEREKPKARPLNGDDLRPPKISQNAILMNLMSLSDKLCDLGPVYCMPNPAFSFKSAFQTL